MFKALFMLKVTGSRIAPRFDHDVAQLDHDMYISAQFELLSVYGHRDLARKSSVSFSEGFLCSRSQGEGQRLNPGLTMALQN